MDTYFVGPNLPAGDEPDAVVGSDSGLTITLPDYRCTRTICITVTDSVCEIVVNGWCGFYRIVSRLGLLAEVVLGTQQWRSAPGEPPDLKLDQQPPPHWCYKRKYQTLEIKAAGLLLVLGVKLRMTKASSEVFSNWSGQFQIPKQRSVADLMKTAHCPPSSELPFSEVCMATLVFLTLSLLQPPSAHFSD